MIASSLYGIDRELEEGRNVRYRSREVGIDGQRWGQHGPAKDAADGVPVKQPRHVFAGLVQLHIVLEVTQY